MIETPRIVTTTAQLTACIHLKIPRTEMMRTFGPAIEELIATLTAQGMPPKDSAFAHHLRMEPETFDFEVGFVTPSPVTPTGRVRPGHWPAQSAARTTYHGGYEGLAEAWGEFMEWIDAESLTPAEDLWEHYVIGPQSNPNPANWRTELTRPLQIQN